MTDYEVRPDETVKMYFRSDDTGFTRLSLVYDADQNLKFAEIDTEPDNYELIESCGTKIHRIQVRDLPNA